LTRQKADYVITLKKNQPKLHTEVEEYFLYNPESAKGAIKTVYEAGHGRVEQREYWLLTDLKWLPMRAEWAGLKSVGMAKSIVTRGAKTSFEIRFFIASLTDIEKFAHAVREHWAIENKLHWGLDVIFREDSDRVKKDNAPLNLNILDKFALQLVTHADMGKISRKRKRYRAALDPDSLISMILCRR
jgi:predicted transposase YbfD/YdcC